MSAFSVSSVFSDHMVLQRGKNINVFGTGEDGDIVSVSLGNSTASARIKSGRWNAVLPPTSGEGLEMTVSCGIFSRTFTDIAMGEVWLAGGQSNMEFELQNCKGGADFLKNDRTENVRFYYTPKINKNEPDYEEKMRNTGWSRFDSESAKCWSAVGYFFAKELADRLGCTVGIIGCNWGGTKVSQWISREAQERDADMREDLDEYLAYTDGKTEEQLTKEYRDYEAYSAEWNRKNAEYYTNTPNPTWDECLKVCGECRYPGPLVPLNPFHPTALYEAMIKHVRPYTIAGFIYYQGESDDPHPYSYYKLLRGLITFWREEWGDDTLPFINTQLPMHRYSGDIDKKNWCIIREAQEKVYKTINNTGLAVIIDCGEFNEIHPKDKVPVGHRLYLQAMRTAYGDTNPACCAPMYKSHIINGSRIDVTVDTAAPLIVKGERTGFEIAGIDGIYRPADFEINGSIISIFSDDVSEPSGARYLWTNYGGVAVFDGNGLPLAPFRTDKTIDDVKL